MLIYNVHHKTRFYFFSWDITKCTCILELKALSISFTSVYGFFSCVHNWVLHDLQGKQARVK